MLRTILFLCLMTSGAAAAVWSPAPMGRWNLPPDAGAAVALCAGDGLALVGGDDTDAYDVPGGRLWIVDLTDPDAPVQDAELSLTGVPTAVTRNGDLVAVAWFHATTNRGALELFDLAAPGGPASVSQMTVFGAPEDLVWRPPYLIAGVRGTGAGIADHLLVEYVASPADPVFVGTSLLPYETTTMALDGTVLYVAGDDDGVPQLEWFDTSDPTYPVLLDSYGLNLLILDIAPRGDRLHVVIAGGTYQLFDFSLGFFWFRSSVDLPANGTGLVERDDIVYVAGGDLSVIDVRDPDHPAVVGGYAAGTAVDVALTDDYAVMLDAGGFWTLPLYHTPTPTAVDGFDARVVDGVVELRWRSDAFAAESFRLNGAAAERIWPVALSEDGRGGYHALDTQAPAGGVAYTLLVDDGDRQVEVARTTVLLTPPAATDLREPYPNPFNPRVTVPFTLSRPGYVVLSVHDVRGRRMAVLVDGVMPVGTHRATWDGVDDKGRILPSGTYHLRLDVDGETSTRTATLLR